MAIEDTVSSVFLFAFIDCKERFRLPPIRCKCIDGSCSVHSYHSHGLHHNREGDHFPFPGSI